MNDIFKGTLNKGGNVYKIKFQIGNNELSINDGEVVWDEFSVHVKTEGPLLHIYNTTMEDCFIEVNSSPNLIKLLKKELGLSVKNYKVSISGFKEMPKALMYFVSLCLICIGLMGFVRWQAKFFVPYISVEEEYQIGSEYFAKCCSNKVLPEDHKSVIELRKLVEKLNYSGNHEIKVFIIESNEINAFALPGGFIVFYSGLLKKAKETEEIIGVLAHEIGHIDFRHGVKAYIEHKFAFVMYFLLLSNNSISDFGDSLISNKYSRIDESSADRFALNLLNKNNISPEGYVHFFEYLKEMDGKESKIKNWLSSHPSHEKRISFVERSIKQNHRYNSLDVDLEIIKKNLKN